MANPQLFWDEEGNPTYSTIGYDPYTDRATGYMDKEGNIWNGLPYLTEEGVPASLKLLVGAEVTRDPYISTIGIAREDPFAAQALYNLKQSNPTEFYNQVSTKLEDKIYGDWRMNNTNSSTQEARNLIEGIKDVNPQAYYTTKLTDLGRNVGWQIGQNRNDRNAPVYEQINALIPEAQAAGLSSDKINSLVGTSINEANAANQQRIINTQASGGNFWTENLIGAAKVGALALGAYGLDNALAAGAGAFTPAVGSGASFSTVPGATYGVGTAAAESALTVPEILASTGFTPTAGSSFAIDPLATYGVGTAAQSLPYTETYYSPFESTNLKGLTAAKIPPISPELALEGTVLPGAAPSTYGSIIAPSLAEGLGVGSGGVLGGGALSAETIATIEAMNAGTGFGLNASQVPNLAAGLELGAIPTSGLSSLLSNAGNLVKGASIAKGLLGAGKNPLQAQAVGAPQAQGRQYAGVDYSPILNLLSIQQPQRSKTSLLG